MFFLAISTHNSQVDLNYLHVYNFNDNSISNSIVFFMLIGILISEFNGFRKIIKYFPYVNFTECFLISNFFF